MLKFRKRSNAKYLGKICLRLQQFSFLPEFIWNAQFCQFDGLLSEQPCSSILRVATSQLIPSSPEGALETSCESRKEFKRVAY